MKLASKIAILLFLFITVPSLAQSPSTGAQLSGTILDPNGSAVPSATVTLRSKAARVERSATSYAYGHYEFLLVPPAPH